MLTSLAISNVVLIGVFGLLMRAITGSWAWLRRLAYAYAALSCLALLIGVFNSDGRHRWLAFKLLNVETHLVMLYGGGAILIVATARRLLGVGRRAASSGEETMESAAKPVDQQPRQRDC